MLPSAREFLYCQYALKGSFIVSVDDNMCIVYYLLYVYYMYFLLCIVLQSVKNEIALLDIVYFIALVLPLALKCVAHTFTPFSTVTYATYCSYVRTYCSYVRTYNNQ